MAGKKKSANGEGSIYQRRRDGRWVCEMVVGWDDQGRKKVVRHIADTRKEVVAWRTERLNERQATGTLVKPSRQTLGEFMARWIETTVVHEVKPATLDLYRQMARTHLQGLADIELGKLTAQNIQAVYHDRLKSGISPRTVQIAHSVLRRCLQQAKEWGLIPRNVADLVKRPRAERHEIEPLTPDQVKAFLEAAKEDRLHALFTLAVLVGLRLGEVLALRWADVDLTKATLTVRHTLSKRGGTFEIGTPKTVASRRTVDLPAVAVSALRKWRREQAAERLRLGEAWGDSDLVFTTPIGTPLNPCNVRNRHFRPLLKRAGLPPIRFHDLRHTAATLMISQGVPLRTIQDILGHADPRMTMGTYGHTLKEQKKAAAAAIDAFMGTGTGSG